MYSWQEFYNSFILRKSFFVVGNFLPYCRNSTTKTKIAGVVVDQNGELIIGANILQKGTSNGTITDINGQFILNCPIGTPLTISYIGFLQQTVKATVNMKIVLHEDSKTLDEVVVVGYGYVKRAILPGLWHK